VYVCVISPSNEIPSNEIPSTLLQAERPSIRLIRSNYSNEPQVMIQWDWLIKWEAPIRHVWLCQSYWLQTKRDNRRQPHFNWGIKTLWNSLYPHAPTMPRQIGWWNDNRVIVMYTVWSQSATAVCIATVTRSAHRGEKTAQGLASDPILCRVIESVNTGNALFTASLPFHMPSSPPLLF